jgi:hypothetical protein
MKIEAWERQVNESEQAYEAFTAYKDLGVKRSLRLVGEKTGKTKACIAQWSSKWGWVERIRAYDNHLARIDMQEKELKIQQALNRHAETGKDFQIKAMEALKSIDFSKLKPLQLVQLFEIAVHLEREALGIAPVSEEIRLKQAEMRIELQKQVVEGRSGGSLEDSSGFLEGLDTISKGIWAKFDSR